MRYIPTPENLVEKFEQAARKMKRNAAIKRIDALNRISRTHGYDGWGHVKWCLAETTFRHETCLEISADLIDPSELNFIREIEYIIDCGENCAQTVVNLKTLILFSTFDGDAWLLDATTNQALCLVWQGKRQSFTIMESEDFFAVEFDAVFSVDGDNFIVRSDNPAIGNRIIGFAYPTDEIAEFSERISKTAANISP